MKTLLKKITGVLLIILGLLALVTPCSPGSWLALIGLELLGFGMLLEKKLLPLLKIAHRKKVQALLDKTRSLFGKKNRRTQNRPKSRAGDPK